MVHNHFSSHPRSWQSVKMLYVDIIGIGIVAIPVDLGQLMYSWTLMGKALVKGTIQRAPRMCVISVYFCLNVRKLYNGPMRPR